MTGQPPAVPNARGYSDNDRVALDCARASKFFCRPNLNHSCDSSPQAAAPLDARHYLVPLLFHLIEQFLQFLREISDGEAQRARAIQNSDAKEVQF